MTGELEAGVPAAGVPPVTGELEAGVPPVAGWLLLTGELEAGVPPVAGWLLLTGELEAGVPPPPVTPPEPVAPALAVEAAPPPVESQPWSKVMAPPRSRATQPRKRTCIAF